MTANSHWCPKWLYRRMNPLLFVALWLTATRDMVFRVVWSRYTQAATLKLVPVSTPGAEPDTYPLVSPGRSTEDAPDLAAAQAVLEPRTSQAHR